MRAAAMTKPATPAPIQKCLHRNPPRDQWADYELSRCASRHSEHLSGPNQSCSLRRREILAGDVNRAYQRKYTSRALEKAAKVGCRQTARPE
jgi:hypothetical protein